MKTATTFSRTWNRICLWNLVLALLWPVASLYGGESYISSYSTATTVTNKDSILFNHWNGTKFVTQQVPAGALLHLAGMVDVKSYGAKGDGSTDDTSAIQAALDQRSGTNQTYYFPPGNYKITASLKLRRENTHLVGAGPNRSRITMVTADVHALMCEPPAENWGGTGAMWQTLIEGLHFVGPGRSNTTAAAIYIGHPTSPGTYFADCLKLNRCKIGTEGSMMTGFAQGVCVSNSVSVVAELCQVYNCNEAFRLAKCDSGLFTDCQTGYVGAWDSYGADNDTRLVCFNIHSAGLGTHIIGGEHGHMRSFARIASGSYVTVMGGNYESFRDQTFEIDNSHVVVINPRILNAQTTKAIYRIASGASKVSVIGGSYGNTVPVFAMDTAGDVPNYFGVGLSATNTSLADAAFTLGTYYRPGSTVLSNAPNALSLSTMGGIKAQTSHKTLQIGADYKDSLTTNTLTANTTKYAEILAPGYGAADYTKQLLEFEDWDGTAPNIKIGGSSITGLSGPTRVRFYTSPDASSTSTLKWELLSDGNLVPAMTTLAIGGAPGSAFSLISNLNTRAIVSAPSVGQTYRPAEIRATNGLPAFTMDEFGDIRLGTNQNSVTISNGFVGIGIAAPTTALQVIGSAQISANYYSSGNMTIGNINYFSCNGRTRFYAPGDGMYTHTKNDGTIIDANTNGVFSAAYGIRYNQLSAVPESVIPADSTTATVTNWFDLNLNGKMYHVATNKVSGGWMYIPAGTIQFTP